MARLLDWPSEVGIRGMTPLSGPRAVGAASSESLAGYVQTVAAPFGLWRWQLTIPPLKGEAYRRYRGMVLALHGGANAVRVQFYDPDGIHRYQYVPFSSGVPWFNGATFASLAETPAIAEAAAVDTSEVKLADEFWGHQLGMGDGIGFTPLHFGLYWVTEVIAAGHYRVWPPLRKAITTDDYATLLPVMAMRLQGEGAAPLSRELETAGQTSITMIEVDHRDVIEYFGGGA